MHAKYLISSSKSSINSISFSVFRSLYFPQVRLGRCRWKTIRRNWWASRGFPRIYCDHRGFVKHFPFVYNFRPSQTQDEKLWLKEEDINNFSETEVQQRKLIGEFHRCGGERNREIITLDWGNSISRFNLWSAIKMCYN